VPVDSRAGLGEKGDWVRKGKMDKSYVRNHREKKLRVTGGGRTLKGIVECWEKSLLEKTNRKKGGGSRFSETRKSKLIKVLLEELIGKTTKETPRNPSRIHRQKGERPFLGGKGLPLGPSKRKL